MARNILLKIAAMTIYATAAIGASSAYPQSSPAQITVLYDAFGKTSTMRRLGILCADRVWWQAYPVRYRQ